MRVLVPLALTTAAAWLSACAIPHNDVLIFGTTTQLAADASASPANGGTPQVSIGYKRTEAVWLPLVLNGQGGPLKSASVAPACPPAAGATAQSCKDELDAFKYRGKSADGSRDVYSVFASFGANISGSATSTNPQAQTGVGLAQFFATGLAAQRLAASGQVGQMLSLQNPDTAAAAAGLALGTEDTTLAKSLAACRDASTAFANATSGNATLTSDADFSNATSDIKQAKTGADFLKIVHRYPQFYGALTSASTNAAC